MAVNKVIYDGATLVDLTGDTVTADNLAAGVKATGADGKPIVGLLPKVTIDAELSLFSTNPVQNKTITAALSNLNIDIATNDEIDNALNVAGSGDLPTTGGSSGGSNYTLPTASNSTLGGVKVGSGLTINTSGVLSADVTASTLSAYAKTTDLSAVAKSGSYNDLSNKPTIPSAYTLPNATSSTLGGVKVGSNISVSSGTISVTKSNVTSALGYTPATTNNASFTGTTMVQTLTVSSVLNIPGGSIWIE